MVNTGQPHSQDFQHEGGALHAANFNTKLLNNHHLYTIRNCNKTYSVLPVFLHMKTMKHCHAEKNLLPGKQKCFPINSDTFLLQKQRFLACPHVSPV
jgi:hypothetical protein